MKTSILIITSLALSFGFTACATSAHESTASSSKTSRTPAVRSGFDRYYNPETGDWDLASNQ